MAWGPCPTCTLLCGYFVPCFRDSRDQAFANPSIATSKHIVLALNFTGLCVKVCSMQASTFCPAPMTVYCGKLWYVVTSTTSESGDISSGILIVWTSWVGWRNTLVKPRTLTTQVLGWYGPKFTQLCNSSWWIEWFYSIDWTPCGCGWKWVLRWSPFRGKKLRTRRKIWTGSTGHLLEDCTWVLPIRHVLRCLRHERYGLSAWGKL